MRWPLIALTLMTAGCTDAIEANGSGEFWLDGTYFLLTENFTDGDCDWWSEDDHNLSESQAPGFCTAVVQIFPRVASADDRWILYEDQAGEVFDAYLDQDMVVHNAGSEGGDASTLTIYNVTNESPIYVDIVWGAEGDPSTFELATLKLIPERWTL